MTSERKFDYAKASLHHIGEEIDRMRADLRAGARYLASLDPQPPGARVAAVKMLRGIQMRGLASADREYREMRADARRKSLKAVST